MAIRKEGGPLVVYDFHNFSYEQEHGPLQMLGPEIIGVCNYLTLEKIYCMLIIRNNYLTNFKKEGGAAMMGNTEQPP